jgi:uncharacterized protein with PQ loop repeat
MVRTLHHHIHKRIRASLGKYPHPNFWVRILDKVVLVAGVLGPLMVTPQIWKIYSTQTALGVAPVSWFAFAFFDIAFITYGIVHRTYPIMITYTLFFVMNLTVAFGAVMYG